MPEVGVNFNVIPALLPRRPSLCYGSHCDNELCAFQSCCPTEAVSQIPAPSRRLVLVSQAKKETNQNLCAWLFCLEFDIPYSDCETLADLMEKNFKKDYLYSGHGKCSIEV